MAATLKPHWIATLRYVAARMDNAADSADRIVDADLDLRTARALERRGLLTRSQFKNWYLTRAGADLVDGDTRPTPDAEDIDIAHAVALVLDEMGITTAAAYAELNADCADMIRDRAALLNGSWTPCSRNTPGHADHDEAQSEDCLTPEYVHLYRRYSGSWTVCQTPDEVAETTERLNDATCPRCRYDGDPVDRTANLLVEAAHEEAKKIHNARPVVARSAPLSARPGNLTYERLDGEHIWRLEGSARTTTEIAADDAAGAQAWAAAAITAGAVDGIPAGTPVTGWHRHSDPGGEWLVPVLGPTRTGTGTAPAAKITPATIAARIRRRAVPVPAYPGRIGTVLIGTATIPGGTGGTGTARTAPSRTGQPVHYLIEKRTGTGDWTEVQSGSTPPMYDHPDREVLDGLADSVRSNVSYVLGRGAQAPDYPVRITTWTDGLAETGHVLIDPSTGGNSPS